MHRNPDTVARPVLPEADRLRERLQKAVDAARHAGADAVEVSAEVGRALTVNVRRSEIESVEFQADRELSVTAYRGKRRASASTTDLSDGGVFAVAQKAAAMAVHTGEDPWAGLADPERLATEFPDLDLHHSWTLDVDAAVELARECEAAALDADPRIENSEGAAVDTREGISAYANSHGFFGCHRGTEHGYGCSVIAREGDRMQRDAWSDVARDPAALESAAAVGRRAGERAASRLGAVTPATRQAPVLFPPELARSLLAHFAAAIGGGNLYRDASFLKDRLGERIFPDGLSLIQRPHLKAAMGSAAFDGEGVATAERDLVRDGVLNGYLLGSYAARRLGMETTGNAGGVFNLCSEGGSGDLAELIRRMGTGLLLTELMGQGVSIVTGDYSRGAAGFWVENGVVAYPVENVTIASNLADVFRGIAAVGDDADARGSIRAPSLLVESMTIAGR